MNFYAMLNLEEKAIQERDAVLFGVVIRENGYSEQDIIEKYSENSVAHELYQRVLAEQELSLRKALKERSRKAWRNPIHELD